MQTNNKWKSINYQDMVVEHHGSEHNDYTLPKYDSTKHLILNRSNFQHATLTIVKEMQNNHDFNMIYDIVPLFQYSHISWSLKWTSFTSCDVITYYCMNLGYLTNQYTHTHWNPIHELSINFPRAFYTCETKGASGFTLPARCTNYNRNYCLIIDYLGRATPSLSVLNSGLPFKWTLLEEGSRTYGAS